MKLDYGTWMPPGSCTSGIIVLVRIDAASKALVEGMGDVLRPTRRDQYRESERRKIARGVDKWQASRRYESYLYCAM